MEESLQLISCLGVQPSYLKYFETRPIRLIYAKANLNLSSNCIDKSIKKTIIEEVSSVDETLDLTGNPLQVTLGEENGTILEVLDDHQNFNKYNKWNSDELEHFPLPVNVARRELNKIFKADANINNKTLPVYVLCKGDDSKNTVILGGYFKDFTVCSIYVEGTISTTEAEQFIKIIIDKYSKKSNTNHKMIDYLVNMSFEIYGYPLENMIILDKSLRELSLDAYISVDVTSTKKIFNVIDDADKVQMKMNVSMVAGHQILPLRSFWMELTKLHSLINIISNTELHQISTTSLDLECTLDEELIFEKIAELTERKILNVKPNTTKQINLTNLRSLDLLDNLWTILCFCRDISSLRNCLHFFFEELANGTSNFISLDNDPSNIGNLVAGIIKGKMAIPIISLSRSVELLFELGARKLKIDFQVILSEFYTEIDQNIDSIWRWFYNACNTVVKKEIRATRATRLINQIDTKLNNMQIDYLAKLYLASEFIHLIKSQIDLNSNFTVDNLKNMLKLIETRYISSKKNELTFENLVENPICNINFELESNSTSLFENKYPNRWTITMKSDKNTTIYDLSTAPIFPDVIYDFGQLKAKNGIYFVSKMVRSLDS